MSLTNYSFTAIYDEDPDGKNSVAGQSVLVSVKGGGAANIFSDDAGLSPLPNPTVTDANGVLSFYVNSGTYEITSGTRTEEINVTNSSEDFKNVTLSEMINWSGVDIGDAFIVSDRASGKFDAITKGTTPNVDLPNGFNIIASAVDLTKVFRLKIVNNIYNIVQFGAIDGAPDNTLPMAAAAAACAITGGTFFEPAGTWIHDQIDIRSNTKMEGVGFTSIDIRKSDAGNPVITKVGYRFFNTATIAPYDPDENCADVFIRYINFQGTVSLDGFAEFKHLFLAQGVTNLNIKYCKFYGFQGDAIVIRSGNFTAAAQNNNVSIKRCVFDGVNQQNRNAISITDADGLYIRDNWFRNCTRFDMPGAIDIEPNAADTYVRLRNIHITGNDFKNIGGNFGAICSFIPISHGLFTNGEPRTWRISGNTMDAVTTGYKLARLNTTDAVDATQNADIKIFNNKTINASDRGYWIYGLKGVKMYGNHWEACANHNRIGWTTAFLKSNSHSVKGDTHRHVGTVDGVAITVYGSDRINLSDNVFDNVGASGGGFGVAISIGAGTSSKVKINNNEIINNEGLTTGAVTVVGTLTPGDNQKIGNNFAGLTSESFIAELTDFGENTLETGIVATAGTQANATQLTSAFNSVDTAAAFDGVKLPTATNEGRLIIVRNTSVNSIQVFPFLGDNLGQGVNSPVSLAAGLSYSFRSYDINNWIRMS